MDPIKDRAVTNFMNQVVAPLPKNISYYEILMMHKDWFEKLYDQAYQDGYRQRDSEKIIEQIK